MGNTVPLEGSCLCGSVRWRFDGDPVSVTACNCTACRRYGTLWAYDYDGERIHVSGATTAYTRAGGGSLSFNFCPTCGCVAYWRGTKVDAEGRRRIAVNVRLAEPAAVGHFPIDHFDGFDTFDDIGRDGRCVRDYWF